MSRRKKRNFRSKHPSNISIDPAVMAAVSSRMPHQKITCQRAFDLAAELSLAPSVVGMAVDLQEVRITACQLGLFGYGKGASPLTGTEQVDDGLKADIHAALAQGRLSCRHAWNIADGRSIPRLEVARACELLGIRISQCQLRAF